MRVMKRVYRYSDITYTAYVLQECIDNEWLDKGKFATLEEALIFGDLGKVLSEEVEKGA